MSKKIIVKKGADLTKYGFKIYVKDLYMTEPVVIEYNAEVRLYVRDNVLSIYVSNDFKFSDVRREYIEGENYILESEAEDDLYFDILINEHLITILEMYKDGVIEIVD